MFKYYHAYIFVATKGLPKMYTMASVYAKCVCEEDFEQLVRVVTGSELYDKLLLVKEVKKKRLAALLDTVEGASYLNRAPDWRIIGDMRKVIAGDVLSFKSRKEKISLLLS